MRIIYALRKISIKLELVGGNIFDFFYFQFIPLVQAHRPPILMPLQLPLMVQYN